MGTLARNRNPACKSIRRFVHRLSPTRSANSDRSADWRINDLVSAEAMPVTHTKADRSRPFRVPYQSFSDQQRYSCNPYNRFFSPYVAENDPCYESRRIWLPIGHSNF